MIQTESSDKGADALQRQNEQQLTHESPPHNWIVRNWKMAASVGGMFAATGVGVALLDWASRAIDDAAAAINFFTQNTFSLLIFLAVIVQAVISNKQWRAMQDSVERTDAIIANMQDQLTSMQGQETIMQGQLDTMKNQEFILTNQAKIMDRTLVLGNRAYLGIRCKFDVSKLRVFLYVENFGRVPAKNVTVIFELEIATPWKHVPHLKPVEGRPSLGGSGLLGFVQNPDEHILKIPYLFAHGRTKIAPGGDSLPVMIRLDESPYISDSERAAIVGGHSRVSLRGEITYSDGFHKGKVTEFAYRYFLKDDIWIPQKIEAPFELYGEPETADSDYDPN